ncbi:hypothetical protein [Vibrio scophthalmi]|uniref:HNH endonuclease n=1 Tax=Vibrio scophthalmi TaxID=45658 RepID=A0A1C7FH76_9VIBR|nr:hypothetical protein [Vibrio scophthalmi]ANU38704.1 hypothetical protein VSVS05_03667 [Vibrio scophthalmi]
MRDNFTAKTIETLRLRVAEKCSNPSCRAPTSAPSPDPLKRLSGGRAAHITAAAPLGARYDANLSPEQRMDISNGIWLCMSCAWKIDSNAQLYSVDLLHEWKTRAEFSASNEWCKSSIAQGGWNTGEELQKARKFISQFSILQQAMFYQSYREGSRLPRDCFNHLQWLRNSLCPQFWNNRNELWSFNPDIRAKQEYIIFLLHHLMARLQIQGWVEERCFSGNLDMVYPRQNYILSAGEKALVNTNLESMFELLNEMESFRAALDH